MQTAAEVDLIIHRKCEVRVMTSVCFASILERKQTDKTHWFHEYALRSKKNLQTQTYSMNMN